MEILNKSGKKITIFGKKILVQKILSFFLLTTYLNFNKRRTTVNLHCFDRFAADERKYRVSLQFV